MEANHFHVIVRHYPYYWQSPISCLPPEILSTIFEAVLHAKNFLNVGKVIRLSHTCQFWRDTALSTPALWADIDLYHPGAQEFSIRSQPFPIRLSCIKFVPSIIPPQLVKSSSWLQTNIHRIQEIVAVTETDPISTLFAILGLTLPSLLSLKVTCTRSGNELPRLDFFAPKLRILDLSHVKLDVNIWGDLTHLSLQDIFSLEDQPLTATQLLTLIRNSPGLRELKLFNIVAQNVPHIRSSESGLWTVELHHLSVLHLRYLMPALATYLLSHFTIPSSAPLIPLYPSQSPYITIDFGTSYVSIRKNPNNTTLYIGDLLMFDGPPVQSMISLVPVIIASIGVSPICDLRVIYHHQLLHRWSEQSLSLKDWTTIFAASSSLTNLTLNLAKSWMRNALQVLHPDKALPLVLCPNLIHLHLEIGAGPSESVARPLDKVVVDYLKARSRNGIFPLETLEMNFGEDLIIRKLRNLVRNLVLLPNYIPLW